MQHAALQSLYVAPRRGKDPRIANTVAGRQHADNGILYMLEDPRDIGKYRTLSPAELKREKAVYAEVAAVVQRRSNSATQERRGVKIAAPAEQRTRQIQQRAWDDKIKDQRLATIEKKNIPIGSRPETSSPTTVGYSVVRARSNSPGSQGLPRPGSAPPGNRRMTSSSDRSSDEPEMETLKQKYVQNLGVIERLASEKKELERTIVALISEKPAPQDLSSKIANIQNNREDKTMNDEQMISDNELLLPPPPEYTNDPDEDRYAWKPKVGTQRLSAAEASEMFDTSPRRARGRSSALRSSTAQLTPGSRGPRDRVGFGGAPGSPSGFVRSRSFDGPRRSNSAPRNKSSGGISYELQADYDRYLQKKRALQENERRIELEKAAYEEEQRHRFMRASKSGSEFKGLKERDQAINSTRQKRSERILRQSTTEKEKELNEEDARKRKYALAAQSSFGMTNDAGHPFSWRDMEEQDEIRRRERVELRKMELANSVAYPSQEIEQSVLQWKMKKLGNEQRIINYIDGISQQRRASDPKQIVSKLERQHNLWEKRLDRELQNSRSLRGQVKIDPKVNDMERRNAEYAEKRRIKALEKDRMERSIQEARQAKEAERINCLLNAKPPAWKLTKTAEDRAKLAKEALEEEARKQQKEEILQKKKERRSKEISAFLYSIISQESSGSGRKSEIRVDDNGVPLAVIEKRREDAMKAKANRDRIKNAVSKRPSLIERHNQQVAQANARAAGLQKVANAISDASKTSKHSSRTVNNYSSSANQSKDDEDYADEFFDYEERIELGH